MKNNKTFLRNYLILSVFNLIYFTYGTYPKNIIDSLKFGHTTSYIYIFNTLYFLLYFSFFVVLASKNRFPLQKDALFEPDNKESFRALFIKFILLILAQLTLSVLDIFLFKLHMITSFIYEITFTIVNWLVIYLILAYNNGSFAKLMMRKKFKYAIVSLVIFDFIIYCVQITLVKQYVIKNIDKMDLSSIASFISSFSDSFYLIPLIHSLIVLVLDTIIGMAIIHHFANLPPESSF